MKNRSHLSYLNRVFKEFVEAGVVEGQGCVEEGVALRKAALRRWT